jgi:ubiquinone/menaquinone biosynthesis C-methylase UbiE/uncharacterized protein YbaR (Trm112 family)
MSKDPKEFIEIFKCPDCEGNLIIDGENMKCEKCERIIPVFDDVAVFLSQDEWRDFFGKNFNFENFIWDEEKDFFKEVLEQSDYLKSIEMIDKYTNSEKNKKDFTEMIESSSTGVEDSENEKAILVANDKTVEKGLAGGAKMILDWPTGPGSCIRRIIKKIGKDSTVVSSEINLFSIFRLKKYLDSKGLSDNILFVNNDVIKMPFKNDIFDLVTVFGLTTEVPDSNKALSETYRVMKNNGIIVGNGEIYKEGSASIKIADEGNIGQLATKDRFLEEMHKIGFKDIDIEAAYEGYDTDNLPDEERCPLPARGDWFSYVIVRAKK